VSEKEKRGTIESSSRKENRQEAKAIRSISENEILGNILSTINKYVSKKDPDPERPFAKFILHRRSRVYYTSAMKGLRATKNFQKAKQKADTKKDEKEREEKRAMRETDHDVQTAETLENREKESESCSAASKRAREIASSTNAAVHCGRVSCEQYVESIPVGGGREEDS